MRSANICFITKTKNPGVTFFSTISAYIYLEPSPVKDTNKYMIVTNTYAGNSFRKSDSIIICTRNYNTDDTFDKTNKDLKKIYIIITRSNYKIFTF
jgi:hypothetical protein